MPHSIFICPICSAPLFAENGALKCENHHSFDIAASGYVNLLNPGKKNNFKAGDSKEMTKARTLFLDSGHYSKIRNALCDMVSEKKCQFIVDAGCGEGYYTESVAKKFRNSAVVGADMSKSGIEHASKSAKRTEIQNVFYTVASIFSLPIASSCADCIINMFAPVAADEFRRVLKTGGRMIIGVSGREHLDGLKRILYSDVYDNEEEAKQYDGFRLLYRKNVKYSEEIHGNSIIQSLFTMTPYYYRTSLSDKEKLRSIDEISTQVEVNFYVYEKI